MDRKVAVITGGAQGIGYLVARQLSQTHRVALVDIEGNGVERAAAECGPDALGVDCNLIDQAEVEHAVDTIVEQTGGIDVVMSAAGIGIGGSLRYTHPDVVAAMMSINVTGNWRFIHACLPHIIERQGYVLGVASGAAIAPTNGLGGYCASKAGLEMLLEVLRLEVAHLGVDVGIAYFLFHDTEMVRIAQQYIPAFARSLANMPGPTHKIYPAQNAADAVVKAIHHRDHHAFSPGYLAEMSATRMALRTRLGSKQAKAQAHEIDELTLQSVDRHGTFDGAVVPTLGCRAAAESVGRTIQIPDEPFDRSPAPA